MAHDLHVTTWPSHLPMADPHLGLCTIWTAVIAYSFFQNPPEIFFHIFKCLVELNQIFLWQFKIENISEEYTNRISLLIWAGVMATLGSTDLAFRSRRRVWAFKITFQNIHRKWMKITLLSYLDAMPLWAVPPNLIIWSPCWKYGSLSDFHSIYRSGFNKIFQNWDVLRALTFWGSEGNICKKMTLW